MVLQNAIAKKRYKNELEQMLFQLSPRTLKHRNMKLAIEELFMKGYISSKEKIMLEMRFIAIATCLKIESLLKDRGLEVLASISVIKETEVSESIGRIECIVAPNWPEPASTILNSYDIPDTGTWGTAMIRNRVNQCNTMQEDEEYKDFWPVLKKYNFNSAAVMPIFNNDRLIGQLSLISHDKVIIDETSLHLAMKEVWKIEHALKTMELECEQDKVLHVKALFCPEQKLVYVEEGFTELTGFTPNEVIYKTYISDFMHPEELQSHMDNVFKLLHKKEITRRVLRFRHKAGYYRICETLARPVLSSNKKLRYVEVTFSVNTKACVEHEKDMNIAVI